MLQTTRCEAEKVTTELDIMGEEPFCVQNYILVKHVSMQSNAPQARDLHTFPEVGFSSNADQDKFATSLMIRSSATRCLGTGSILSKSSSLEDPSNEENHPRPHYWRDRSSLPDDRTVPVSILQK